MRRKTRLRSTASLSRRRRIPAQSAKRRREQRVRREAMLAAFGTDPLCRRCGRRADDAHEVVTRARGGSITDPGNIVPLCRPCHRYVTDNPQAARAEGFTRWSWEDGAA